MTQYINKDALVAEIERLKKKNDAYNKPSNIADVCYKEILSAINTFEVKEVDFETAFAASIDHFDEKNNYSQWSESDLRNFAEHFFELGMQQSITKEQMYASDVLTGIKSFKPQSHWKPTEEQMVVLTEIVNYCAGCASPHFNDFIYNTLKDLRNDIMNL